MQDRYPAPGALGLSRRILAGLRVLNVAYAIGIALLLLASFAVPELFFRALGFGPVPAPDTVWAMRGIMIAGIAGAFVGHRILTTLLRMVDTVRDGDPFLLANASRLQSLAWWLLGAEGLHILVGALARIASTPQRQLDIEYSFSFTPWIAVLMLFVLARVFAHGARMREDLEGTV